MSKKSNKRTQKKRAEQLGMPYGTASGRLKKKVLFNLVQKLGENICFQCKKEIKTAEELSIEHKKPWYNNDVNLFWDMDNIAFSHLKCNSGARVVPKKCPNNQGSKNGHAKLKEADVLEIRKSKKSVKELAKEYNVSLSCIKQARSNKSRKWRQLKE